MCVGRGLGSSSLQSYDKPLRVEARGGSGGINGLWWVWLVGVGVWRGCELPGVYDSICFGGRLVVGWWQP